MVKKQDQLRESKAGVSGEKHYKEMRLESKNQNAARPGPMARFIAPMLGCVILSAGCTPTYNWRTVSLADLPVQVQLPCKPDQTMKTVPMGKGQVALHAAGCEQANTHWSVMGARLGSEDDAQKVLSQWQQLSMKHMQAEAHNMDAAQNSSAIGTQKNPTQTRSAVFLVGADARKGFAHVSWHVFEVAQVSYIVQAMAMYGNKENNNTALQEARTHFHDSIREYTGP